jgi:hypothetical protein
VTASGNLLLLAAIYFGTSYGIVPMTRWAAGRTVRQLETVVTLFVRALALLLLFVTFLFLTNEIWQTNASLVGPFYWSVLAAFPFAGMMFATIRLPREVGRLGAFESWETLVDRARGTPAEELADVVDHEEARGGSPGLGRRQWGNVGLVVLFSQGLQLVLVSAVLFAVLVGFGVVVVTEPIAKGFLGATPNVLATVHLSGRTMVVTEEMLRVAGFLTAFSAFYFTVTVLTDQAYREEFLNDVVDEVGRALAVRAIYLAARTGGPTVRTA